MLINSTKDKIAYKKSYGVVTLRRVMALFLTTKFNKLIQNVGWKQNARAPPHFDLISKNSNRR